MLSQDAPISEDEWLLRRVFHDRFFPVAVGAFEPRTKGRDPDITGISLYREACLSEPARVLSIISPDKRQYSGLVRLRVKWLVENGLTVVREDDNAIPGHVVIPELNAKEFQENRARLLPIIKKLADMASQNIALWPACLKDARDQG